MTRTTVPGAAEKATAIFTAVAEHRWADASTDFSGPVRNALGESGLADAYANVVALAGELEQQGTPEVLGLAGVTVVAPARGRGPRRPGELRRRRFGGGALVRPGARHGPPWGE